MKTYSEAQGKPKFDWNKFLENPPEDRSDEHLFASTLSSKWVTCACGNLCDIIPRSIKGKPDDRELERLGIEFDYEIKKGDFVTAKETLAKIEKLSTEIIERLTK